MRLVLATKRESDLPLSLLRTALTCPTASVANLSGLCVRADFEVGGDSSDDAGRFATELAVSFVDGTIGLQPCATSARLIDEDASELKLGLSPLML
jgi:hypothetical protein